MISALYITGIYSFLGFLKTAVFAVRIYSKWKFISRTINSRRRERMFRKNEKWR